MLFILSNNNFSLLLAAVSHQSKRMAHFIDWHMVDHRLTAQVCQITPQGIDHVLRRCVLFVAPVRF